MAVSKKAIIGFLFSVFLMSGMTALVCTGVLKLSENFLIVHGYAIIIMLAAAFLVLFLLIFLLLDIGRRHSHKRSKKKLKKRPKPAADPSIAPRKEPKIVTRHSDGLLAAASRLSKSTNPAVINETPDIIYEQDGIPYINSGMVNHDEHKLDNNFIKLVEAVTGKN